MRRQIGRRLKEHDLEDEFIEQITGLELDVIDSISFSKVKGLLNEYFKKQEELAEVREEKKRRKKLRKLREKEERLNKSI